MATELCIPVAYGFVFKQKPGETAGILSENELFFVPGVAVKPEDYRSAVHLLTLELVKHIAEKYLRGVTFDPREGMQALERLISWRSTPIGMLKWQIAKLSVTDAKVLIDKHESKRVA